MINSNKSIFSFDRVFTNMNLLTIFCSVAFKGTVKSSRLTISVTGYLSQGQHNLSADMKGLLSQLGIFYTDRCVFYTF